MFATKLPLLDKTLGEVMADLADPISIPNERVSFVSTVVVDGANRRFVVDASGLGLVDQGVGIGDAVFYRSAGREVQGTIAAVDSSGFIVTFAAGLDQAPDAANPAFRIVGPGTIKSQLTSFLDGLRHRLSFHESTPTLQDLVEEVAGLLGVDSDELGLRVTGTGLDRTVQFAIPFNPDPITFTEHLDLAASVPGLAFDGSGDVKFTVDPQFRIPIGIRLGPDVPVEKRFFLAEDDAPEITLAVSAVIDDPSIAGKIADVFQVRLQEDGTVVPNQGISLTSTIHVNVVDPTSGSAADKRITLDEFNPSALTDMFVVDIDGALDIDGLTLTADVGGASLGSLKISIDGATDGHIDSLDDLIAVLSRIKVEGNLGLPEDIPIPAFVRDALLQGLLTVVNWSDRLDDTAPFTLELPLTDTSLAKALDLPARLRSRLYEPVAAYFAADTTPTVNGLVAALRHEFAGLVSDVSQTELVFDLDLALTGSTQVPIDLGAQAASLGLSVDASATLALAAGLRFVRAADENTPKFTFGVNLAPGVDLDEAFFIRAEKFVATGSLSATNLNAGIKAGFLGAQVVGGSVALDGRVTGTLTDPDGDGRITIGELVGAAADAFSNLTPTGTLEATLPVQATVGGQPLSTATGDARPMIVVKDDNLFAGAAPTFEARNFEDLLNFSTVTPESFLALIQQLASWLGGFGDSGVFGTRIPFTADKTLGDVVDLGRAFTDQLVGLLESPDGTPNYSTVQELTQKLVARLGGDPSRVHYDAATNLLTFDVTLSESVRAGAGCDRLRRRPGSVGQREQLEHRERGRRRHARRHLRHRSVPAAPRHHARGPARRRLAHQPFLHPGRLADRLGPGDCRRHRCDRATVQLRGDRRRQRHGRGGSLAGARPQGPEYPAGHQWAHHPLGAVSRAARSYDAGRGEP